MHLPGGNRALLRGVKYFCGSATRGGGRKLQGRFKDRFSFWQKVKGREYKCCLQVPDSSVYELVIWKQRKAVYQTFLSDDSKLSALADIGEDCK